MIGYSDPLIRSMKCFDQFKLDVTNQCLWRGDARVPVMPKPFDVLTYLVEHAGRLIPQDELLKAVWPGTYVQPDVLRKHIKEVRRVLGDMAATPHFIETLPKRGYRFIPPVWEQTAVADPVGRAAVSTLVGRAPVLAALRDRLQRALAGERQVVFVTGEAGIGKTSVVQAFERSVSGIDPIRAAWGQAVEGFGGKEPYYPVLGALGRFGRGPDRPLIVDTLATCAPTWLIQMPSLVPPEQRASLRRETVGATTQRMVRELCEALETLTRTISLVLILEDLHWVDHSTLDALSAIARGREPARLLIIATYRPVNVILSDSPFKHLQRDLCMRGLAHEIALEPLSAPDIARYLATAFSPNQFPPGLEGVLHLHSGGNPLFTSATLDHLVQRGMLEWDGGCWNLTLPLERIEPGVPETLRHLLELQLEQLTDDERLVLTCASVAGETFSASDVAIMLAGVAIDPESVCDALVTRGQFLRTAGMTDRPDGARESVYEFKHALYRDALYRRVPAMTLTGYHHRLADALNAVRAAGRAELAGAAAAHYEAARVYDRAVNNLIVSADNALGRYAHGDALALLNYAHELNQRTQDTERGRRELDLLQRIGDAEYARGEMTHAAAAYERAAEMAIDSQSWSAAAQALLRAARAAVFFDVQRALDACERAAQVAGNPGMPALAARSTLVRLCWELLHRGWSRARAAEAAAAFETLYRSDADLTPADHILYANVQVFRSEYAEASARADAALRQLQPSDTLWEHLGALAAKGGALALQGRWGDAHETLTIALEIARRNENGPWLDILSGLFGSLHLQACDFARARDVASGRLAADPRDPGAPTQMHVLLVRGGAELGLGHLREAMRIFSAVRATTSNDQPIIQWYWRLQAQLGLAESALAAGDLPRARDEISHLTDAVADLDETMIAALAWECRARVDVARNGPDSAEASISRALQTVATCDVPSASWRVHVTAAAIRQLTDPARAEAHWDRARTILTGLAKSLEPHPRLHQSFLSSFAIQAILSGSHVMAATPARGRRNSRSS